MAATKRLYLCKIIEQNVAGVIWRKPAISLVKDAIGMPAFPAVFVDWGDLLDGSPKLPWCLVAATGVDHTLAVGNPDIDPLPVFPLATLLSSMPTQVAAAKSKLAARGINTTALFNGAVTYGDVLRGLLQLHGLTRSEHEFSA